MKKLPKNIIVLYNLPQGNSVDDLDTQKCALEVMRGLKAAGYEIEVVGISKDQIVDVKHLTTDLVFNLVEWAGLDYHLGVKVIEELEKTGLPYTGSDPWGYAVSCDKVLMKKLLDKNNIPTPRWQVVHNFKFKNGFASRANLKFPLIAKTVHEHAAIGMSQKSVVETEADLRSLISDLLEEFHQPILVEEYIAGDEAQVTVLEKLGQPWVLPPAVFRYQKKPGYWPINTYAAKWGTGWEAAMSSWTEDVAPHLVTQMQDLARICYLKLGGRGYPRIDMRLTPAGKIYVLEVNTNPGIDFDPESGIAVSAQKAGLSWPMLLTNIVEEAYLFHHRNRYDPALL